VGAYIYGNGDKSLATAQDAATTLSADNFQLKRHQAGHSISSISSSSSSSRRLDADDDRRMTAVCQNGETIFRCPINAYIISNK